MSNTVDILNSLGSVSTSPEFRFWNSDEGAGVTIVAGSMVTRQTYIHKFSVTKGRHLALSLNELMVFAQSILGVGDNEQLDYVWNAVFVSIGVTKKFITFRTVWNSYSLLCDDVGRVSFASALMKLHEFVSNDCNGSFTSGLSTQSATVATKETSIGEKKNIDDNVMYYSDPHVG